jgi:hypothetical protein
VIDTDCIGSCIFYYPLVVIDTDCIGSCIFYHHLITTTTAPYIYNVYIYLTNNPYNILWVTDRSILNKNQLQSTLYIYHKYMHPSKRPITASGIWYPKPIHFVVEIHVFVFCLINTNLYITNNSFIYRKSTNAVIFTVLL